MSRGICQVATESLRQRPAGMCVRSILNFVGEDEGAVSTANGDIRVPPGRFPISQEAIRRKLIAEAVAIMLWPLLRASWSNT